ncbi:hypothetical protein C8039_03150 [Halogeometricum sp. wsp3]|nr:hypothetical protein C8039_03150 [Halogeometricum sp. wsp3]
MRTLDHFTQTETADEQADEPASSLLSSRERSGSTPTPSRSPRNSSSRLQVATKQVTRSPGVAAEWDDVTGDAYREDQLLPQEVIDRPDGPIDLATNLPDPTVAETVAVGITERVQPDEVRVTSSSLLATLSGFCRRSNWTTYSR